MNVMQPASKTTNGSGVNESLGAFGGPGAAHKAMSIIDTDRSTSGNVPSAPARLQAKAYNPIEITLVEPSRQEVMFDCLSTRTVSHTFHSCQSHMGSDDVSALTHSANWHRT